VKDDVYLREATLRGLLEPLDARFLGPKAFIYCYARPKSIEPGVPARAFLDSLPDEAAASYAKSFEKHCAGLILRGEKHRPWTEKNCKDLYEYKDIQSKSRVVHVYEPGFVEVLLFGFGGKNENKVDEEQISLAKRLRDEFRARSTTLKNEIARRRK
jgi:hypothetical protein